MISSNEQSNPKDISRQEYLQQYAHDELGEEIIAYWQEHLHNFVPKPETAHKSRYTEQARWMAALKELAPSSYETLLKQWKITHKRRSNLWKAMREMGL